MVQESYQNNTISRVDMKPGNGESIQANLVSQLMEPPEQSEPCRIRFYHHFTTRDEKRQKLILSIR